MKFELRKVHHMPSLSEETNAYSADLYVDGQLIAHVSNRGHGGCDDQHPAKGRTNADLQRVEEWIKANHPPRETGMKLPSGEMFLMDITLETICGELLESHLASKKLERLLKRTVAYFDPDKKAVYNFKGTLVAEQRAHAITDTLRKKPNAVILNNLPFDEALKVFIGASA